MDYHVLLGGPESDLPENFVPSPTASYVGVDHGAIRLMEAGFQPSLAVGDFDSVTDQEMRILEGALTDQQIIRAPSEKDETDAELAIDEILKRGDASKIFIYGGSGGRLDHMLSMLVLPLQEKYRAHIHRFRLVDKYNTVSFYSPGHYQVMRVPGMEYIAFGSLTGVEGLVLENLKYPLDGFSSTQPFIFTSNEFLAQSANFSFQAGSLLVIQSKDE